MARIVLLDQHLIYDNPIPHVKSRHGYFPGIVQLPSGELLALFVIAEAFEAANATTWISRSSDEGRTWRLQGPLRGNSSAGAATSDSLKATLLDDGSLIACGYRFHRHDPESPISIPATGGILPGDDIAVFSADGGLTWTEPSVIPRSRPELLEISGPCIQTRSGDLLAVSANYPLPDGSAPSGHIGVLLRSPDRGRTWDDTAVFFRDPSLPITPYEPRITEMAGGCLVAIVWAYDSVAGCHHTNRVVVSHDGGYTWSPPIDTGHRGQASSLLALDRERLLSIHSHRGVENPGIYVRLIDFTGDRWRPVAETVIFGQAAGRQTVAGQSSSEMFKSLRFGQPSVTRLASGDFLAVHWCVEDGQGKIRAHRLRIED
jgi:sialidase-1